MTQEFGVYDPATAKEIKRRVMGGDRVSPNDYSAARDQRSEDRYYAVLTEALPAASNPLTGARNVIVRLLKDLDYEDGTKELVEGDQGLITVKHRFEYISAPKGTLVVIDKVHAEWFISGMDCKASPTLLAALAELE
jgi:hypothetical protein